MQRLSLGGVGYRLLRSAWNHRLGHLLPGPPGIPPPIPLTVGPVTDPLGPNHELHLRIDVRAMRFKSRSRRISVWNSTAPRWARKVMNSRYARSVCAWRNTA